MEYFKSLVNLLLNEKSNNALVQFFRYAFVGGAAFVVDFGLLFILTDKIGVYYLLSATISFVCGLLINYALSIRWVFSKRRLSDTRMEFIIFGIIGVIGVGINNAIIWCGVEIAGLHYLWSKIIAAVAVLLWNFTARRQTLFK
jgi:putative flippase GtrA